MPPYLQSSQYSDEKSYASHSAPTTIRMIKYCDAFAISEAGINTLQYISPGKCSRQSICALRQSLENNTMDCLCSYRVDSYSSELQRVRPNLLSIVIQVQVCISICHKWSGHVHFPYKCWNIWVWKKRSPGFICQRRCGRTFHSPFHMKTFRNPSPFPRYWLEYLSWFHISNRMHKKYKLQWPALPFSEFMADLIRLHFPIHSLYILQNIRKSE